MDFIQFKHEWLGRAVDYDHVYAYQCVDLILEYVKECYGLSAGVRGNAIDYWTATSPPLLEKFTHVTGSDAREGDIVVLHGLASNALGHIGIATGNLNTSSVEILEQNGSSGNGLGQGGDRIRVRYVGRQRVAGLLRPKVVAHAPSAAVHPYVIEPITPKQLRLNKDCHLWGLNYDNLTAIVNNPQADAIAGTLFTARAILHHNIGYRYYLADPSVASGYNVVDADDYIPAPPPPPAPRPLPSAPMILPNTEQYDVVVEVDGYLTSNMAINHIQPKVKVQAGTYFVFNKRFRNDDASRLWAINVTKVPGKPGAWIAANDNVEAPPPPPPAPAEPVVAEVAAPAAPEYETTYKAAAVADTYIAMRSLPVVDLSGKNKTVTMPQYSVTKIAGDFSFEGRDYFRPKSAADKDMWYGIEKTDPTTGLASLEKEATVYDSHTTLQDRQVTKTLKPADKAALAIAHTRNFALGFAALLGKIKLGNKNKN